MVMAFTGQREFFNWGVFRHLVWFFLVGVSSVYERIEEEGGGCARGERAGSRSQEEGEEATGSDREDRRRGRRHKRRHNPDADREGPIAGKEGGRDIEKKGVVGSE